MTLANLTFYSMMAFGLAYIVGHSTISEPIRRRIDPIRLDEPPNKALTIGADLRLIIVTLLECPACFGFWTGLGFGLWIGLGWTSIALGLYTAATNYTIARITNL